MPAPLNTSAVEVRAAIPADFRFVSRLMLSVLPEYYDGDHFAHAKRIFETSIKGGVDDLGYFSTEQQMFIATVAGRRAGVIHLVTKKQGTFKISPIIVAKAFRRGHGIGTALLAFAERYALSRGGRQIYGTVSQTNQDALRFLLHNGYIVAGASYGHYKPNVVEIMVYKPLGAGGLQTRYEDPNISVQPMARGADARRQVRELLLETLPDHFSGIDDGWIASLFAGYARRKSGDINTKYKLIYTATDRAKRVLGVAAGTPKKGTPIKLMPFVARTLPAFFAMLRDIPFLLNTYGRKLYIHIDPTAEQVVLLQQSGWVLAAMLPNAYKSGVTTQEWTYDVSPESASVVLRTKPGLFGMIRQGVKTLEVRVGYPATIRRIKPGSRVLLETLPYVLPVQIRAIRRYPSLDLALANEDPNRIWPDHDRIAILQALQQIYPRYKERLGVYVLEFAPPQPHETLSTSEFAFLRTHPEFRRDIPGTSRTHS